MTEQTVTPAGQSLKRKLVDFIESLEPEEQAIFLRGVSHGMSDEVQGYDWNAFVDSLYADWHRLMYGSTGSLNVIPQSGSLGIGTD
jgi:hypothetical protein